MGVGVGITITITITASTIAMTSGPPSRMGLFLSLFLFLCA